MSGRNSASASAGLRVLFDGWPLVYAPGSPAALHLHELLAQLPPAAEPLLAVPSEPVHPVPAPAVVVKTAATGRGRLAWEQVILPRLARRHAAALLHTCALSAPLASPVPVIASPAEDIPQGFSVQPGAGRSLGWRLRAAMGRGGLPAAAVLWPADLPSVPDGLPAPRRLPPVAHAAFWREPAAAAPEDRGYVAVRLQQGDESLLDVLLDAWRWAATAVGEEWSLQVSGISHQPANRLEGLRQEYRLPGPVLPVTIDSPQAAAAWIAGAGAVLHLGATSPWGDVLLHALAAGRPIAAEETPRVDARVGPAAYLAPRGDRRALGAALLTLLVEEQVAEQVSRAGHARAASWASQNFSTQLGEVYADALRQRRMNST